MRKTTIPFTSCVHVGTIVVYPTRDGHSPVLRYMVVETVTAETVRGYTYTLDPNTMGYERSRKPITWSGRFWNTVFPASLPEPLRDVVRARAWRVRGA